MKLVTTALFAAAAIANADTVIFKNTRPEAGLGQMSTDFDVVEGLTCILMPEGDGPFQATDTTYGLLPREGQSAISCADGFKLVVTDFATNCSSFMEEVADDSLVLGTFQGPADYDRQRTLGDFVMETTCRTAASSAAIVNAGAAVISLLAGAILL